MLSKIYVVILGLSLIAMGFFIFYSWSWLQSIGLPAAAAEGYEYHAAIAWPLLWITTLALLVLGNAILWATGRSWAMWTSFLYFAAMAVVRFFWLDQSYSQFRVANRLAAQSITLGPFLAVIMIAVMGAIVFFDQFIILRLRQKMYPTAPEPIIEAAGSTSEENA